MFVEEDFGDGSFPKYRDIQFVRDIIRIGAEGLKIRFREVDPAIWDWLIEALLEAGRERIDREQRVQQLQILEDQIGSDHDLSTVS